MDHERQRVKTVILETPGIDDALGYRRLPGEGYNGGSFVFMLFVWAACLWVTGFVLIDEGC